MAVTVRFARQDEAEAVAALATDTFPLACPPTLGPDDIRDYIATHLTGAHFAEHLASDQREVLVAEEDGELLGYVLLFFGPDGEPSAELGVTLAPAGLLSKLYVRPGHHGAGVSRLLMDGAIERGRVRGCDGLWLNVNYANLRAQRFYEKTGWVRVGYVDFVVGGAVHRDPVYQLSIS